MKRSYLNAANILGGFVAGIIVFALALYMLGAKVNFLWNSSPFEAVIVEVSHEPVAAGRGSQLVYVPIVQLPTASGFTTPVKVDTHDGSPIYFVGSKINVLCNLSTTPSCVRNNFAEIWLPIFVAFGISFIFISVSLAVKNATNDSPPSDWY